MRRRTPTLLFGPVTSPATPPTTMGSNIATPSTPRPIPTPRRALRCIMSPNSKPAAAPSSVGAVRALVSIHAGVDAECS